PPERRRAPARDARPRVVPARALARPRRAHRAPRPPPPGRVRGALAAPQSRRGAQHRPDLARSQPGGRAVRPPAAPAVGHGGPRRVRGRGPGGADARVGLRLPRGGGQASGQSPPDRSDHLARPRGEVIGTPSESTVAVQGKPVSWHGPATVSEEPKPASVMEATGSVPGKAGRGR